MGKHSFSDSERKSYVEYINSSLRPGRNPEVDKLLGAITLPLQPDSEDELFKEVAKGLLLG
jgi:hypothetical protein